MSRDIFDGDWILDCETVALTLYPCLVDQDASIGRETCRRHQPPPRSWLYEEHTGKRETDVVVKHGDLPDSARVLQLEHRLLLDTEDYDVLAAYSYLQGREMVSVRIVQFHVPRMSPSSPLPMRIRPVPCVRREIPQRLRVDCPYLEQMTIGGEDGERCKPESERDSN